MKLETLIKKREALEKQIADAEARPNGRDAAARN